jgi:hypothetical protein
VAVLRASRPQRRGQGRRGQDALATAGETPALQDLGLTLYTDGVSWPSLKPKGGFRMKKYTVSALGLVLFFALQAFAQEHYTEGPIWQVTLIRVKPTQMDAYLTSLRANTKSIYEEMKKQGVILDYKVFLNTTKHDPQDWDISIGVQYKNFAAMDGLTAKGETIRDKVLGSKQAALQIGEKRQDMREIVSVLILREVTLK